MSMFHDWSEEAAENIYHPQYLRLGKMWANSHTDSMVESLLWRLYSASVCLYTDLKMLKHDV